MRAPLWPTELSRLGCLSDDDGPRTRDLCRDKAVLWPTELRHHDLAYAAEESNLDCPRLEAGRAFRYASGACLPKESNPHLMA